MLGRARYGSNRYPKGMPMRIAIPFLCRKQGDLCTFNYPLMFQEIEHHKNAAINESYIYARLYNLCCWFQALIDIAYWVILPPTKPQRHREVLVAKARKLWGSAQHFSVPFHVDNNLFHIWVEVSVRIGAEQPICSCTFRFSQSSLFSILRRFQWIQNESKFCWTLKCVSLRSENDTDMIEILSDQWSWGCSGEQ
jgi:hypothetical protein